MKADLRNAAPSASVPEAFWIGVSPVWQQVEARLREAAPTGLSVLLLGETGTGKSLIAQRLHPLSPRQDGPFVSVNCGALPESLVDSELFGHEKGAFTGAVSRKPGKIERAQGGTLFLDEIGDLPLATQARLLHVLQERHIERVGGVQALPVDVRVVAATHRDLEGMVAQGSFRADLFYRLHVFPIRVPSLRERPEDLPRLALHFAGRYAAALGYPAPALGEEVLARLRARSWPGNVRELEHVLQRAVVRAHGSEIRPEHLVEERPAPAVPPVEEVALLSGAQEVPLLPATEEAGILPLAEYERRYLARVLAHTQGVIHGQRGAAMLLGMKPTTLRSRLEKLGLK
jgi:transcriptional regulator with GAF, ATPase, and Fis domain